MVKKAKDKQKKARGAIKAAKKENDAQREKEIERTNPLVFDSQVLVKFGSLPLRRYTGTFHVFQVCCLYLILYYFYVYDMCTAFTNIVSCAVQRLHRQR